MITFIICIIIFMVLDEAIRKHGDLKSLIDELKNTEE